MKAFNGTGAGHANRAVKRRSNFRSALARLLNNRFNVIGGALLLVLILLALFSNIVAPYDPNGVNLSISLNPPSARHWLGTDKLGRDILSRIIAGTSISLQVSFGAVSISLLIGTFLGLSAGYAGGRFGNAIMRTMDALWSLPSLILALAIATVLGPGLKNVILAVGVTFTPAFARIVYAEVISIKEELYIRAARSIGESNLGIIFTEILPNCIMSIIVYASMMAGEAVIAEASLSFLGVGVPPPHSAWGSMLRSDYKYFAIAPWASIFPGFAIFLLVLAFNLLGDGLRDALDVKLIEKDV
jgi:peptide/nickel transport system permease protein